MRWGKMHPAQDLACPVGSPVHALSSGTVVFARQRDGKCELRSREQPERRAGQGERSKERPGRKHSQAPGTGKNTVRPSASRWPTRAERAGVVAGPGAVNDPAIAGSDPAM